MEEKNQDIIEVNGKKYKFIPHEKREACTELCAFRNLDFEECWNIPCNSQERKDGKTGYFVELNKDETNNLKPFNIEAAKAGKPVCTRDGRKARIICFDAKGDKPIIALIEMGVAETPNNYPIDGKAVSIKENSCDLMMLPEKKEGWVNVYKGGLLDTKSYPTKKEAFDKACPEGYVDTIKISWEE